ncbi:hemerythrin domain-containing protein [Streptomyces sp. IBSBF 2435]|uniref:hemerythrin domain-containing protein n=1 Tax=Streptomyces sp. IBSBF 2435 TaxID=2903531 RepID=UPI002FDBC5D2
MSGNVDFTLMYAMHNALRRDVAHIARITAGTDDDPRRILGNTAGWELFKRALHIHHTAEDEALWPQMAVALADRPDDLAVVEAMEAEHAGIDPLLEAIDLALADRDCGPQRVGDLTDALAGTLGRHLTHEETDTLPLIETSLTAEQIQNFGTVHAAKGGPDGPRITPWMLDGQDDRIVAATLAVLPPPLRTVYENQWQPAYASVDWWSSRV